MDTEVNQVSEEVHEKEIILVNGEELDNKDILAKLCIDAESISTDIRDCLRAYDLELTTRQLKVAFHAFQKNVIVDTLNFLKEVVICTYTLNFFSFFWRFRPFYKKNQKNGDFWRQPHFFM